MLSFTLALISVLSFHLSLAASANVRRLLAEDESAIELCNRRFGGSLLPHHVSTLQQHIPKFNINWIPSFPPHFWNGLAPLLQRLHGDQLHELSEFLNSVNDGISKRQPEEIQPLFDFTKTRSMHDFIAILASLFKFQTPSFLNVMDIANVFDFSSNLNVQITHGYQNIRFAGIELDHQIDVKKTQQEAETIWKIQVLKPSECKQDLKDGQFCCRFQSWFYKPDPVGDRQLVKNWLVALDDGERIGCYGGPGPWTYFIAHPKPGHKVQLESDSFPGWF
eukprot:202856_1